MKQESLIDVVVTFCFEKKIPTYKCYVSGGKKVFSFLFLIKAQPLG